MATTDEYVKYDIRFFNEFAKYLDFSETEIETLLRAVEMGIIQRDRLVELAISKTGNIKMDSTHGQDLADKSDVKTVVSGIRNNNKEKGSWTHSFSVRGVANKNGALRVVAYNKLLDRFHYFFIPYEAYQHCQYTVEIIAENFNNIFIEPNFTGIPNLNRKWWNYEVDSFELLCQKNYNQH